MCIITVLQNMIRKGYSPMQTVAYVTHRPSLDDIVFISGFDDKFIVELCEKIDKNNEGDFYDSVVIRNETTSVQSRLVVCCGMWMVLYYGVPHTVEFKGKEFKGKEFKKAGSKRTQPKSSGVTFSEKQENIIEKVIIPPLSSFATNVSISVDDTPTYTSILRAASPQRGGRKKRVKFGQGPNGNETRTYSPKKSPPREVNALSDRVIDNPILRGFGVYSESTGKSGRPKKYRFQVVDIDRNRRTAQILFLKNKPTSLPDHHTEIYKLDNGTWQATDVPSQYNKSSMVFHQ